MKTALRRGLRTVLAGSLLFGGLTTISLAAANFLTADTASGSAVSLFSFTTPGTTATVTATASATPTSGQIPVLVKFTGTATGGTAPYSYSWNFGDGSATSTTQNPSHTYTNAGTYTATLTVTDSSSPPKSITASVAITASPVNGTVPGAPTNVTAIAGKGKITLEWHAPSSDGGEPISAYEVFRGTSSGTETYLTSGSCSNLGAVLTCTDTGLTSGTTYYYYVIAANAIGTGPQSNEASAPFVAPSCYVESWPSAVRGYPALPTMGTPPPGFFIGDHEGLWKLYAHNLTGFDQFTGTITTVGIFSNVQLISGESGDSVTSPNVHTINFSFHLGARSVNGVSFFAHCGDKITFKDLKEDGTLVPPSEILLGNPTTAATSNPVIFTKSY